MQLEAVKEIVDVIKQMCPDLNYIDPNLIFKNLKGDDKDGHKTKVDNFIRAVARKGISYIELVELSGVSKATIHRIKSSKDSRYNRTSARNVGKLAKALDVDVTEISTI